jgi:hypothetical protein
MVLLHTRSFLRPRGQNKHKHKVAIHTQETIQATANTIKITQGKQQTIAEITQGTSSTNDA